MIIHGLHLAVLHKNQSGGG